MYVCVCVRVRVRVCVRVLVCKKRLIIKNRNRFYGLMPNITVTWQEINTAESELCRNYPFFHDTVIATFYMVREYVTKIRRTAIFPMIGVRVF